MQSFRVWACSLGAFALLGLVPAPAAAPRPERPPLLGDAVVPSTYDLRIEPRTWSASGGFADGTETIVIDVKTRTRAVALNAAGIRIRSAEIDGQRASAALYPIAQQLSISTGRTLLPGRHVLRLRFVGRILSDADGLWPDSMLDNAHPNLVSLFEPATARTLFPCFDEPRFRARFTLHIVAPAGWRAISNMPVVRTTPAEDGKRAFSFAQTPPIPAYLLAIDMGRFSVVRGRAGATPIRVDIQPGKQRLAREILRNAEQALLFYEREFGVAYPLPKLDVVVASGVLNDEEEFPGAITEYTQYGLSGEQFEGGLRGREFAFNEVAQPLAQQWFGGLVGIASWRESWLTASLASWAEYRAERALHPEFAAVPKDIDWQWNAISPWGSLRPLRTGNADDRDPAAFESLMAGSTDAGEAVADQWDAYVGDAVMRRAVHQFLTTYAWRSATSAEFWSAFGSQAARRYGSACLNQPGAPALAVSVKCSRGRQIVTLSQRSISGGDVRDRPHALWPVPVSLTAGGKTLWTMLSGPSKVLAAGSCGVPVLADRGLRPPYPTHYSLPELQRLQKVSLAPIDRLRIVRDTATLYNGNAATVREMLAALKIGAVSPPVAETAADAYGDLERDARALQNSPQAAAFFSDVNAALLPVVRSAGFRGSGMRGNLARIYAVLDYAPLPAFAASVNDAWRATRRKDTLSPLALPYAAAAGSTADFDWALAHAANSAAEPPAYFYLAGARNRQTMVSILGKLKERHVWYPAIVWEMGKFEPRIISAYLDAHAQDILAALPASEREAAFAAGIADGPWTARTPSEWQAFLAKYLPAGSPQLAAAMEKIRREWALRRRLEAQLRSAG